MNILSPRIRDETPADFEVIHALTLAAFKPMPFSQGDEADIVDELRACGDLTLSIVADVAGHVVGHVAFSPVTIDGLHAGWFGLGPISVAPALQRQGIGKALIGHGLQRLRDRKSVGCVLIGNPDIYGRAGFINSGRLTYRDLDSRLVQWIAFWGDVPRGQLRFAPALEG